MENLEQENAERKIATSREGLPPLKEGYVRVVHLTSKDAAENILKIGLDYGQHGMLQSMARAWSKEEEVEFSSDDPRFRGENIVAVVMDMPEAEYRLHDSMTKSPEVVSPDRIVGIISK